MSSQVDAIGQIAGWTSDGVDRQPCLCAGGNAGLELHLTPVLALYEFAIRRRSETVNAVDGHSPAE